jgi:hypothetical protein
MQAMLDRRREFEEMDGVEKDPAANGTGVVKEDDEVFTIGDCGGACGVEEGADVGADIGVDIEAPV